MAIQSSSISIILPAKNEAEGLRRTLPALRSLQPDAEIIVVDDGSSDATAEVASAHGACVLSSPYSMGNGAAIKRGVRAATGDILIFMDADGQHDPAHIRELLSKLEAGYDMVVGARGREGQANAGRGLANAFYNWLASWMTGHKVLDLTSGFRAVRADKFREFLHLLPNGFSYPTTSTMAFFRSAYSVAYVPVPVASRVGTG
ncbi:MAG: glycosyltransferase family 2 protein, partial [Pseudomonadota bacterium]|nr:glycosyltransferase family 2 protein [Pseudomonadota bacterium]